MNAVVEFSMMPSALDGSDDKMSVEEREATRQHLTSWFATCEIRSFVMVFDACA